MTWYAFWDAADAFVETEAFQDAKAALLVVGVIVVIWAWLGKKPPLV